jgi:hypothetical protein
VFCVTGWLFFDYFSVTLAAPLTADRLGALPAVWLWKEAVLVPAFIVFLVMLMAISIIEGSHFL